MLTRFYQNVSSFPNVMRQRLQNRWGLAEYRRKSRHIRIILYTFSLLIALDILFPPFRALLNISFWAIIGVLSLWGAYYVVILAISALSGRSETPEQAGNRQMGEEIVAGWANRSRPR